MKQNFQRNQKCCGHGGSLKGHLGAVAHRDYADQKLLLYSKVPKPVNVTEKLGRLSYYPDRPNRNSLLLDAVNNCSEGRFVQEVAKVWSLGEAIEEFKPDLLKADIEGAELDAVLKGGGLQSRGSVREALIYFHLDKHPELIKFDKFLSKLEGVFKQVHLERCAMLDLVDVAGNKLDWRRECRQKPDLARRTENLGFASAKQDVLVYCSSL